MPNWCENDVELVAPTEEEAVLFETALIGGNLFNHYLPVEVDDTTEVIVGLPQWYLDRVAKWGVKWDVDPSAATITRDGRRISCFIETAWGPPLRFWEHLASNGWQVRATYFEPNMIFGGFWSPEDQQEWRYEVESFSRESLPGYLVDAFGAGYFDPYFDDHEDKEDQQ